MTTGIFNPYVEKKPKKYERAPTDEEMYSEEYGGPAKDDVKLDGNSYILELKEADLEDVPGRLGELLYGVMQEHPAHMLQHGINLTPLDAALKVEDNELSLPTPSGHISVYVDKEKDETEVWRRVAHALHLLPNNQILVKHKARIIVR